MLDSLLDARLTAFSVLALAGLACLVGWWRTRRRGWLFGLGTAAALAALFALLDAVVETRREQIALRLQRMAAAVEARQTDVILEGLAANFLYEGKDREAFRRLITRASQLNYARSLRLWDFDFPEGATDTACPVEFKAKPQGDWNNDAFYLVRARFVREPDGQWRLRDFQVFNPFIESNQPIPIPNLP